MPYTLCPKPHPERVESRTASRGGAPSAPAPPVPCSPPRQVKDRFTGRRTKYYVLKSFVAVCDVFLQVRLRLRGRARLTVRVGARFGVRGRFGSGANPKPTPTPKPKPKPTPAPGQLYESAVRRRELDRKLAERQASMAPASRPGLLAAVTIELPAALTFLPHLPGSPALARTSGGSAGSSSHAAEALHEAEAIAEDPHTLHAMCQEWTLLLTTYYSLLTTSTPTYYY